jgi:hypothetical protein
MAHAYAAHVVIGIAGPGDEFHRVGKEFLVGKDDPETSLREEFLRHFKEILYGADFEFGDAPVQSGPKKTQGILLPA